MKAVILAGGFGSRIGEEYQAKPKPMVEIGGKPILWHIMKIYSAHGVRDFVVCCGYKGYVIKEFFANYRLHISDIVYSAKTTQIEFENCSIEDWKVTVVDTGEGTETGGRLKRVASYLGEEDFCMTYGDGVANINIQKLIEHHRLRGTLATVTAVPPPVRFGALALDGDRVTGFKEKAVGEMGFINGGFFVLSPKVLDYIEGDGVAWELDPMERLVREGNLSAYRHGGFWHPMDTPRDKLKLNELWNSGKAPWKVW